MTKDGDKPRRGALRADRALMHEEGACLPLRSKHGQCRACAQACPTQALQVSLAVVELSEACIGCGQCVAACPTEALMLPGLQSVFDVRAHRDPSLPDEPPAERPIRVECRKVPPDRLAPGTLVLPCTGALTTGVVLAHEAQGQGLQLVDRGWCQGCEANGRSDAAGHPAQAALETARLWLSAMDVPSHSAIAIEPLPLALRPTTIPEPEAVEPGIGRRSFFRAALERPAGRDRAKPIPMGGDGRAAYPASERRAAPERTRVLQAMRRLAEQAEREVPAEVFATIYVSGDCCDRRMCVALCPTAALTVADNGIGAHLQFDAQRCISCGVCERACPEGALQFTPHGGRSGVHTLISHHRRSCRSCGERYTPHQLADPSDGSSEAPSLCPSCKKSQSFMDDARRQLFGSLN